MLQIHKQNWKILLSPYRKAHGNYCLGPNHILLPYCPSHYSFMMPWSLKCFAGDITNPVYFLPLDYIARYSKHFQKHSIFLQFTFWFNLGFSPLFSLNFSLSNVFPNIAWDFLNNNSCSFPGWLWPQSSNGTKPMFSPWQLQEN